MGEVFAGRYELIDQIGQGGMGAVWRVHDRKRDELVAAKLVRQADAGTLLRFMREQGMRIHHPNVVTPLGWAGEDDEVLFTMPLVDGGSVSDLTKRHGPLPPRYAAELVRQLLDGLSAVHAQRVVHRDIKPANLLLAASGIGRPHLWLTDFGVAVSQDEARLTTQPVVFGTPGYLAPEQLKGADPEPRSDLYAVGQVTAQLLNGHQPRGELNSFSLPNLPAGTPESLRQFVTALCAYDIEQRPRDAVQALRLLGDPQLAWQEQSDVDVRVCLPPIPTHGGGEFHPVTVRLPVSPANSVQRPAPRAESILDRTLQPGSPSTVDAPRASASNDSDPGATAVPGPGAPSSRRPMWAKLTLVLAPLLALAVVAAVVLTWPRGAGEQHCGWQDVGQVVDGMHCVAKGSTYVWQE